MRLTFPFFKYAGSGNEFIYIDNRTQRLPHDVKAIVKELCDRKDGLGADGIITVENSFTADFKMRIFNADGGEAEMCGNGARCLFPFLHQIDKPKSHYHIETLCTHIELRGDPNNVCVSMPEPVEFQGPLEIITEEGPLTLYGLNTGVPHVVSFVSNLKSHQWMIQAPKIRYHQHFHPLGTNVNFVQMDSTYLHIRTYERGVEAETAACGTGAVAAALIAAQLYSKPSPILVIPLSGELLTIHFTKTPFGFTQVELYGPVQFLSKGEYAVNIRSLNPQPMGII